MFKKQLDPPDCEETPMSIVVLQALVAAYAAVTFAVALRMRSRARIVTVTFPREVEQREPALT